MPVRSKIAPDVLLYGSFRRVAPEEAAHREGIA